MSSKVTKTSKKRITRRFNALRVELMESTATMQDAVVQMEERMQTLNADATIPQDLLEAAVALETITKVVSRVRKKFDAAMLEHCQAGGRIQNGRVVLEIKETSRRSILWRDVARELVEKADEDVEAWEANLKLSVVPRTSFKVLLHENS